ncbi:MAG: radical SAM protein [Desulfobacterales bacterium]|nr:radical SAM protein [Desulfobacterales bacterium]
MLLIHPPVAKPGEPPAGPARLAFALRSRGIGCRVWDANLEGLLDLLGRPVAARDTWTRRAVARVTENLAALRSPEISRSLDRYKRAVMDINRVLQMAGKAAGSHITLANYGDARFSPVKSKDLLDAAARFHENPFYSFFKKRLPELIDKSHPRIVGFSVNFISQAVCAFAMAGFIRNHWPNIRIIMGGGLVTSWLAVKGFDNPFASVIDELVCGPGEGRLFSMAGFSETPAAPQPGFDYADFPMNLYLSPGRVLPYAASRGCYWQKCRFCPEKFENTRYQAFDRSAIRSDLNRLQKETRPSLIHFLDNALSPAFLKALIADPPGAPWYGFVRITDHLTDPAFARGLKDSGCVMLKLGIESGAQHVLDALNKGISIDTVSRALKTVSEAGILIYGYLLFGTPAEDYEAACQTRSFILAHADCIDFLNLAIFNLPVGSPEADALDTVDFYPGDLSLYREFVHPRGWDRSRVRRFLVKEFKRPGPIREILKKDPLFFTSNHAPFFLSRSGR